MKTALITGITGQDGSYLAELLLAKGYAVHGIIRRASTFNTERIDHIYQAPHTVPRTASLSLHFGDLTDGTGLRRVLEKARPDEVYNLGAQSHVKVSFDQPEYTGRRRGDGHAPPARRRADYVAHTEGGRPGLPSRVVGDVRGGKAPPERVDAVPAAQPLRGRQGRRALATRRTIARRTASSSRTGCCSTTSRHAAARPSSRGR